MSAVQLKAGTHYPCPRPVNTGIILDTRVHGRTREHDQSTRVACTELEAYIYLYIKTSSSDMREAGGSVWSRGWGGGPDHGQWTTTPLKVVPQRRDNVFFLGNNFIHPSSFFTCDVKRLKQTNESKRPRKS